MGHGSKSRGLRRAAFAGLATALVTGVAAWSEESPRAVPVILISVDTLRADHLSCYGYRRFRTPHIDSLCSSATVFTRIDSQVPLTLPSHVCLFTSTYPFASGVEENDERLEPGAVTLATLLKSRGYRTAAFIGGYFLARQFGFDQGFDLYEAPFGNSSGSLARPLDLKRPAATVTREAMAWLNRQPDESFFVFIHLFDLHQPYNPPAPLEKLYGRDEYDAELASVDESLGRLWSFLARRQLFDRSLIVFTSDHGESLGDHGESTHGYFVYQSTLHVPLIIHWPEGAGPYPKRVDAPAGLIDLAPTILQALGAPIPAGFQGHSLFEFLHGDAPGVPRAVYSESNYAHDRLGFAPLGTLRLGNEQYIEAPRPELYDLGRDSKELHNLAPADKSLARSLRSELLALRAEYGGAKPVARTRPSGELAANLRSLGYLAESAPRPRAEESGPDPKDRLAEYRQYLRGIRLLSIGQLGEAEATFKEILDEDAGSLTGHYDLALCYLGERRIFDAITELRNTLAIAPGDVQADELLATAWLDAGQFERARAEFHYLLTLAPQDYTAQYGLGALGRREGRFDDAVRHLDAALQIRPQSAEVRVELGQVYLARRQYPRAEEEFAEAVRLRPHSAAAHYDLGLALENEQRRPEAAQAFRQALKCDPRFVAARDALESLRSTQR